MGALYFPRDEVGDCHKFMQGLARHAEGRGVRFLYGVLSPASGARATVYPG